MAYPVEVRRHILSVRAKDQLTYEQTAARFGVGIASLVRWSRSIERKRPDAPLLPELLSQIPPDEDIATVMADGAYDTRKCHDTIAKRGAAAIIPPRKNAKP